MERRWQLTRRCLEVFLKYRNPVSLITKNHPVTRDLDILGAWRPSTWCTVTLSITSLDRQLTAAMEPRTSRPERRLHALEGLSRAGVPAGVNVAPLIPGLNDSEAPALEWTQPVKAVLVNWMSLPHTWSGRSTVSPRSRYGSDAEGREWSAAGGGLEGL